MVNGHCIFSIEEEQLGLQYRITLTDWDWQVGEEENETTCSHLIITLDS